MQFYAPRVCTPNLPVGVRYFRSASRGPMVGGRSRGRSGGDLVPSTHRRGYGRRDLTADQPGTHRWRLAAQRKGALEKPAPSGCQRTCLGGDNEAKRRRLRIRRRSSRRATQSRDTIGRKRSSGAVERSASQTGRRSRQFDAVALGPGQSQRRCHRRRLDPAPTLCRGSR